MAGRLLHYWKEDLKGGKSKICAVFLDGQTFQNVLTAEAWSDADQAHAEKHLKPLLGQVVALENGKIASKGKTTVFHGKQIKLSYDKETVVKKLDNNEKYGKALPLLTIADCSKLQSLCAISLVVCIQTVSGPHIRATDGDGMTKDQTVGIKISSISNNDPTAPTLVSPADGSTVSKPVTFQWTKSTDADNDDLTFSKSPSPKNGMP